MKIILTAIFVLVLSSTAFCGDKNCGGLAAHIGMGAMYGAGDGFGAASDFCRTEFLAPSIDHMIGILMTIPGLSIYRRS